MRPDGVSLAYQVFGEGPPIVFCYGWISHLDLQWTEPDMAKFFNRLGTIGRVIAYDKAGTGLSDPIPQVATLEERVEDIRTVMDAVGVERASLFGESEGGPTATLFAASYPERTTALILYGSVAKGNPTVEELVELGVDPGRAAATFTQLSVAVDQWGSGLTIPALAPSRDNAITRRTAGIFERSSVSPRMAQALLDSLQYIDVTQVAPNVSVPTLVVHRRDELLPVESARWLASVIPGAKLVELDGVDHAYFHDGDQILDEVERFLTGGLARPEADRALATVMFSDIVDSTRRAAELGDTGWRTLLERHDELLRRGVESAGGRVVKSLGDGALATFPGPARAIGCAQALIAEAGEHGLELRTGVHTGECEVMGDDLGGIAVHIGARISALAGAGEVLVSSAVKDLVVGSPLRFSDRGEHELKGVPGRWHLFAVGEERPPASPMDGPRDHMTLADRATVRMARRAPGAIRAMARLTQRR
jgi:class 3 adenylate cyclase